MSAYEAIWQSVADETGADVEDVRRALEHRDHLGDYFWNAWDNAVRESVDWFNEVRAVTSA